MHQNDKVELGKHQDKHAAYTVGLALIGDGNIALLCVWH